MSSAGPLAEIDGLIRRAAGEAVTLAVDAAADLWQVFVDPAQFESALLNLTINARDATPEGGRLTFSARNRIIGGTKADRLGIAACRYVVVKVADAGTGMPPEILDHAFAPFFSTKDVDKGTGLGLARMYGLPSNPEEQPPSKAHSEPERRSCSICLKTKLIIR